MNFYVTDPLTNDTARVLENRLQTNSIIRFEDNEASLNGDAYLVSSGYINYTVATPVAVLYIKNNEDEDIFIERFNFNLQASTGGAVDFGRFIFYRNPEGMSNGTAGTNVANLNFGSSNTLDIDFEVGDGSTSAMTGGTPFGSPLIQEGNVFFIAGNLTLPKGTSFGVAYVPPAGNTAQSVGIGLNVFKSTI